MWEGSNGNKAQLSSELANANDDATIGKGEERKRKLFPNIIWEQDSRFATSQAQIWFFNEQQKLETTK